MRARPTRWLLAASLAPAIAGAVPLLDGFGGPDGYGTPDHCVAMGNDNSYTAPGASEPTAIDLRPAFPGGLSLFGRTYDHFYLNTNGNITFLAPLATATPRAYPIADQPMIAPWWADVDTRAGGSICFHLEPNRLVVTWHDVGSFDAQGERRDDFQLVLTTRPRCDLANGVAIEFRYNRCEWARGAGGGFAQIGYDADDRANYVTVPMSGTAGVTGVCTTTNVAGGAPGLFRFQTSIERGPYDFTTPCTVPGRQGLCARGLRYGAGECVAVYEPAAPGCNGLDNDCDGVVDERCPSGQACDRGRCLPRCAADDNCPAGTGCTILHGCIEDACLERTCAVGQTCHAGLCVDICADVTCPAGQRCLSGRCSDPCRNITCAAPYICDRDPSSRTVGLCVQRCECSACPDGRVCGTDGLCAQPTPRPDGGVPVDAPVAVDASDDVAERDVPMTTVDASAIDAGAVDVGPTDRGRLVNAGCGCRTGAPAHAPSLALVALALAARARRRRRR